MSYHGNLCQETTTTSGTGTLTLLGAVSGREALSARVNIGDPCVVRIEDANGTANEIVEGTLTDSTHFTRDTVEESTNSDAKISLSSGTHKVSLVWSAERADKTFVAGDRLIDHVVDGNLLPSSSGTLAGTITGGRSYVIGRRCVSGDIVKTFAATKDNWVDRNNKGLLVFPTPVTVGDPAPTLSANSIRLGRVRTNGSTILSAVTSGFDSLGNTIRNELAFPTASAAFSGASVTVANGGEFAIPFGSGTNVINNDLIHDEATNNTRFTFQRRRWYDFDANIRFGSNANGSYYIQCFRNGSAYSPWTDFKEMGSGANNPQLRLAGGDLFDVGEYLELVTIQFVGSDATLESANMIIRGR